MVIDQIIPTSVNLSHYSATFSFPWLLLDVKVPLLLWDAMSCHTPLTSKPNFPENESPSSGQKYRRCAAMHILLLRCGWLLGPVAKWPHHFISYRLIYMYLHIHSYVSLLRLGESVWSCLRCTLRISNNHSVSAYATYLHI